MEKNLSDSDSQTIPENDNEQSLVDKLKRNVSGIINITPLSRWFRKQNDVRRREDDSDDEQDLQDLQPPVKRTRLPSSKEALSLNVSEALSPIVSNNVKKPTYKNFPEPIPGPSGYQTRKMLSSTTISSENNSKLTIKEGTENVVRNSKTSRSETNVNKDSQSDSEESTSGYSSGRICSKEIVSNGNSKQASPLNKSSVKTRSLFHNTSSSHMFLSDPISSPNRNSSLSSRMPSFNPSTFGSSSFIDRTLSTKKILSSPFYSGKTVYGGASAYGKKSRRESQDMRKILRQSIDIKPTNRGIDKGDLQLGKTARRILDTLEQYSSPINDVKKIPVPSKGLRGDGTLTKYIGANPYSVRGLHSASNRELQVPSVTDLLKMKLDQQKTRLQDSTESVRQIATKAKNVLTQETYQIPVQREKDKHTGKIKTKKTSVRQKIQVDESVPEVNLNPVTLHIKELPKFDVVVPPPGYNPNNTSSKTKISLSVENHSKQIDDPTKINDDVTINEKSSFENQMEFKFSAPLILAEYLKPLKALNNFKFSEPLIKKRKSIHPEWNSQEDESIDSTKLKNNGENTSSLFSNVKEKDNSVKSLFDQFKPKEGTWECSVCMIRNQPDKVKCVACETPKNLKNQKDTPKSSATSSKPLSSTLIQSKDFSKTWECPTCMIRNKDDLETCAACSTKKPDITKVKPVSNFGDKFKPESDTWKCSTCLVVNKNNLNKCMACETEKPNSAATKPPLVSKTPLNGTSFGTSFAPPSDTWECSVCMIRNKNEVLKCIACESGKPGSKSDINSNSFGANYKKKEDEWECEVCMVRNKSTSSKCQCCESLKPGATAASRSSDTKTTKISSFSFGIDKNTATGFTFGIPPALQTNQETSKTNVQIVFDQKKQEASTAGPAPTFTFGLPANSTNSSVKTSEPKADSINTKEKEKENDSAKTTPAFSFGIPAKTEKAAENTVTPVFSFGAPPKNDDKTKDGNSNEIGKEANKNELLSKSSEKLPEKSSAATPVFSFGLPKAVAPPPVSSNTSIDQKSEESPSKRSNPGGDIPDSPKVPMFSFKGPSTNSDSKSIEVNKPSIGGFSFKSESSKTNFLGTTTPVGSNTAKTENLKAGSFSFGASSSDAHKQTNGCNFGPSITSKDSTRSSPAKQFSFPVSSGNTSFGAPVAKPPAFQFGAGTENKSQTASPSFSFNTSLANAKSASQTTFGSNSKSSSFSFGNSSTPTTNFNFTSPQSKPEFSFGTGAAERSFAATPSNKQQERIFGGNTNTNPNGMFNFGSGASANQKAGFSFGAPVGSVSSSSTGGFNFGSSSTTTPSSSTGFNFSAPPSFDVNAKPSFNFTGGAAIAAFSAPPPPDGSVPQRKIKKAIRRAVR